MLIPLALLAGLRLSTLTTPLTLLAGLTAPLTLLRRALLRLTPLTLLRRLAVTGLLPPLSLLSLSLLSLNRLSLGAGLTPALVVGILRLPAAPTLLVSLAPVAHRGPSSSCVLLVRVLPCPLTMLEPAGPNCCLIPRVEPGDLAGRPLVV